MIYLLNVNPLHLLYVISVKEVDCNGVGTQNTKLK